MNFLKIFCGIALTLSFAACDSTLRDADGNSYKTVKIGSQIWQAENMKVKTAHSLCYDYDSLNCEKYGRLYSWNEAQTICPEGWHLPTEQDFEILRKFLGKTQKGALNTIKIRSKEWDGTDEYGFALLPAGFLDFSSKNFGNLKSDAYLWSATDSNKDYACSLNIYEDEAFLLNNDKKDGYSVRCVKD